MRYTGYDPMAWLYATHWGGEFHEQSYGILKRLLLDQLPRGAHVLDLCCGDGRIAEQMRMEAFAVTGLDGSERMLDFARGRNPEIEFVLGDARGFQFPNRFDAVISTFDALNHVMSAGELDAVFQCVSAVLKPGGCFFFDLNREEAYSSLWTATYAIVEPEFVNVCCGHWDPTRRVAWSDFTLFRKDPAGWARSDFRMEQYCHSAGDVVTGLAESGFERIEVLDAAKDAGMFGNIGKGRNFYRAYRPDA